MLQVTMAVSLLLVAMVMALALAHLLEWPGKMRLPKEAYLTTQTIYYPGFTIGGAAEPLAVLVVLLLLLQLATGSRNWWLVLCALLALIVLHALFWLRNQPVNRIWVKTLRLGGAGGAFFATGLDFGRIGADWMLLRDRWEQAHAIRAGLGILSFILLVFAVVGPFAG
jgi:hypothetical protein